MDALTVLLLAEEGLGPEHVATFERPERGLDAEAPARGCSPVVREREREDSARESDLGRRAPARLLEDASRLDLRHDRVRQRRAERRAVHADVDVVGDADVLEATRVEVRDEERTGERCLGGLDRCRPRTKRSVDDIRRAAARRESQADDPAANRRDVAHGGRLALYAVKRQPGPFGMSDPSARRSSHGGNLAQRT